MSMEQVENKDFEELMDFISSQYTKEEIDWYLSLVPQCKTESTVVIKTSSSNTYANEK